MSKTGGVKGKGKQVTAKDQTQTGTPGKPGYGVDPKAGSYGDPTPQKAGYSTEVGKKK